MNHAFLIMAYNEPMLLARIVDRLKAPNHYMFIHIDKKSNIEEFKAYQPEDSHTVYLGGGNREKVFWGGFSQIMTEIHLMRVSYSFQERMDYFHLISGQDYPCKSNEYIDTFFESHDGQSFLGYDIPQNPELYAVRYRKYYFNDATYCDNVFLNLLKYPIKAIQKVIFLRPSIKGINKGPNWFSLHRQVIEYVLETIDRDKSFLNRLRYTSCMDETLLQTILASKKEELKINNNYLRYIKWDKNYRHGNSPLFLTNKQYNSIITSDAIFCRKVSLDVSKDLLNHLDSYLSQH